MPTDLPPPPTRRRRWWNARREERALTLGKVVAASAAVVLVAGGWWLVEELMAEPGRRLAEVCASGPAAHAPITRAGGPEQAADRPDVLTPYSRVPALTERWLGQVRSHASRGDDQELTRAAFLALRAGGLARSLEHLAQVERRCVVHMEAHEVAPAPQDWFRP